MAMTVVDQLMTKHDVDWNQIGYVQVGTNSTTDKSKSIFTFLMQLWTARGAESFDIEGVDNISGTYGGTAAFFNVLNWLESTAWDGRMGLAVATDITIYDRGRPRSLSGAAAVAILMGAHAPLIVEPGLRTNFAAHVYDLFKPIPDSQYPVSFPELRDEWYFRSMEDCYKKFCRKCEERGIFSRQTNRHSAHDFDAVVFQCPYVKVASSLLQDFTTQTTSGHPQRKGTSTTQTWKVPKNMLAMNQHSQARTLSQKSCR
jgi:hydroxymethylglutaryl-CoA synthase